MYNHTDPASSGIDQWTLSHGSPPAAFSVAMPPSLIRIKPRLVAAQIVPSGPGRRWYTLIVSVRSPVEIASFHAAIAEMDHATIREPEPEAAKRGICGSGGGESRCAELREAA